MLSLSLLLLQMGLGGSVSLGEEGTEQPLSAPSTAELKFAA